MTLSTLAMPHWRIFIQIYLWIILMPRPFKYFWFSRTQAFPTFNPNASLVCIVIGWTYRKLEKHEFSWLYIWWKKWQWDIFLYNDNYNLYRSQKYQVLLVIKFFNLSVQFLFRLACSWLIEPMTTVRTGNALARVQWEHKPVDLWDITFCTRKFWGSKYYWHPQSSLL